MDNKRHFKDRQPYQVGGGTVSIVDNRVILEKGVSLGNAYSNAQIDDYQPLKRRDFLWHPPLRLSLRARFSHPAATLSGSQSGPGLVRSALTGTAGFGFWNDPFMMTGRRRPTLPRSLWFFYSSPPSDMQLAYGVQGWGWKAAVIDALRLPFFALLPTAPFGFLLMRSPVLYPLLWPIAQRSMHVQETLLTQPIENWHSYELVWQRQQVCFWIDGKLVFQTEYAPLGPLGLVLWLDNQYMIVKPTGVVRAGLVKSKNVEFLEIEDLQIE